MSQRFRHWYNPWFDIPKRRKPDGIDPDDLRSFIESESVDRELRVLQLAEQYGVEVAEILRWARVEL